MTSIWTDESIDALKTGVMEGKSNSVIGQELTKKFEVEFTRNAIAGQIYRLKMGKKSPPIIFQGRSKSVTRRKPQTPVNGTRYNNVVELFGSPKIDIEKTPPLNVRIDELDQADISVGGRCNMCRYPSGTSKDMFYCGLPTGGKSSWCSYHRQFTVRVGQHVKDAH